MPIRDRSRYPVDWDLISGRIKFERAKYQCECPGGEEYCGVEHAHGRCMHRHRGRLPSGGLVILTTAHLNHTPEDNRPENLMAMCQLCHLRYDRKANLLQAKRTRAARRQGKKLSFEAACSRRRPADKVPGPSAPPPPPKRP